MQPHDNDQRPAQSDTDGGRNIEPSAYEAAVRLARAAGLNLAYRPVRIAEPGKPFNLSASLTAGGTISG